MHEQTDKPIEPPGPADTISTCRVVGLGASAGGLEALERFFNHMPSDTGMAYVVIQHLSPDYKSLMAEILSKHTEMEVYRAENGMVPQPNCVYLIPPKKNILLFHGRLLLTEPDLNRGVNLPIDAFFQSLAEDQADRAVGVILSGTGSDGMRGVRAIKDAGGMVMVQDEESAKFDGMPRSALSTGLVDFVLPPEDMPAQLLRFVEHPFAQMPEPPQAALLGDEANLARVASLVHERTGLDLSHYKPSIISRRVGRRMNISQIESLPEYTRYLGNSPREVQQLYREILIGVTNFFRDPPAFEFLREHALADLFKQARDERVLRVWVAGCSTGEEAYSLAILLREFSETLEHPCQVKVFATDIDQEAIEFASSGMYPESVATDMPPEQFARYFTRVGPQCQIVRAIREMVVFATQNLLKDPPFTRIDLVTCRNLLIYLKPEVQRRLLGMFSFSLRPGGVLMLGPSETVGDLTSQFKPLDSKWKIFRNTENRAGERPQIPPLTTRQPDGPAPRKLAHEPTRRRGDNMETVYTALLEDYVPSAIVVDEFKQVVHVFGNVERYLKLSTGSASLDLNRLLLNELSVPVNAALHRAGKERKDIVYRDVQLPGEDDESTSVDIRVKPVNDRRSEEPLLVIFFEETDRPRPDPAAEIHSADETTQERITDLERELQYNKENLQATIEELETSNEELQATNEELIASNEELQSTNEELQSVNEELYTINAEYQNKIQELTDLNNDMDNLLQYTSIGSLFLDESLCIRKATPAVSNFMNVMDQDIGRPMRHITHSLEYHDLSDVCRKVMDTLTPVERTVPGSGDRHVLVRIAPYREERKASRQGVVIHFVDVSELYNARQALEQQRDMLVRVMDASPAPVIIFNRDGKVTYASPGSRELFGNGQKDLLGRSYDDPAWGFCTPHGESLDRARLPFRQVMDTGRSLKQIELSCRQNGQLQTLHCQASPVLDEDEQLDGVIVFLSDSPLPPTEPMG